MKANKSIEVLEGDYWGEPPDDAPRLVKRCYALRQKPVDRLGIEDLRLLLSQEIGMTIVLPRAVDILERDLLAEGDFYPGDLLQSVLMVNNEHWKAHPQLKAKLQNILRARRKEVENARHSDEIRRDMETAIDRFLVG